MRFPDRCSSWATTAKPGDLCPTATRWPKSDIPAPVLAANPEDLPVAGFLQDFADVTAGYFTDLEEIPKAGMQYLNHPDTGPKIHLAWGQHLQPMDAASHAWFNPTLTAPDLQGVWFIGNRESLQRQRVSVRNSRRLGGRVCLRALSGHRTDAGRRAGRDGTGAVCLPAVVGRRGGARVGHAPGRNRAPPV